MYDNVINFFSPNIFYIEYFYKNNLPTNHPPLHPVGIRMYFEHKYVISIQLSDNQFNYHSSPHFQLGGSSPQTVLSQGAIEAPTLTQVFFSKELNKNLLIKWALVVHKAFKSHPK